jgi:uncharacterized protein (DUF2461 family)
MLIKKVDFQKDRKIFLENLPLFEKQLTKLIDNYQISLISAL